MIGIEWIQYILNFEFFTNPQFTSPYGLGRVGFIGTILGIFVGFHLCCVIILSAAFLLLRIQDENHVLLELSWTFSPWILLLWSVYILFLSLFHTSEFLITALYNPNTVTADSFVVNHSQTYTAAVLLSFMEFWIEALFVPSIKRNYKILNILGLLLIIGGSSCRLVAMATCGPNFHHKIQLEQATGHTLVTHGIYNYLRHPSYFGWFYWSIGTQLLLGNPLCTIGYAVTGYLFFRHRITYEEEILQRQYPQQYPNYIDCTYIGIPWISSSKITSTTTLPNNNISTPTTKQKAT